MIGKRRFIGGCGTMNAQRLKMSMVVEVGRVKRPFAVRSMVSVLNGQDSGPTDRTGNTITYNVCKIGNEIIEIDG